jgi:polyhydroxybutyrate depolymerase
MKHLHHRACLITLLLLALLLLPRCDRDARQRFLFHDGRLRSYYLHIPPGYDGAAPVPLVVVLHGGGGSGENVEQQSGMSLKADAEGFIAVYPNGSGRFRNRLLTWNAGFCCAYALENDVDDVGFIRALLEKLQQRYAIDEKKIFVTGMSNGGIMSYRLAAEMPDVFAAAAPVAASLGGQAAENAPLRTPSPPAQPVSIIAFNGMQDNRIPYEGGIPAEDDTRGAYSYLSVAESVAFWTENNICSAGAEREISPSGNIILDTWSGCDAGTAVVLYSIVDGGHAWPGGEKGWSGGDEPTHDISATAIMWDFFKTHPKQ